MATKRNVFLYELDGTQAAEFDTQVECGHYLGCSESAVRRYKNSNKSFKGFYIFSSEKLAETFFELNDAMSSSIEETNSSINEFNEALYDEIYNYDGPQDNSVLDSRLKELGYNKESVSSVKTWQTQSGETRFSIITKLEQIDSEEFLSRLEAKLTSEIVPYNNPYDLFASVGNKDLIDLIVYTSDKHVGADTTGSQYSNEYNKEIFKNRIKELYANIEYIKASYGQVGKLIFIDLGDNLDGYKGYTTRGGHSLPQNMTDEESFNTYIEAHTQLFDSMIANKTAMEYDFICVNDSNHSGSFGYTANRALEIYLNAKYPFVNTRLMTKFMEHFILGDEAYILCHGKDSIDMKSGLPYHLDAKTYKMISDYIDYNKLYKYSKIHFIKGDLHQNGFESNSKFDYRNVPSIFGASKWIMNNFGMNKPGFTMDIIHKGNCYKYDYEYEV